MRFIKEISSSVNEITLAISDVAKFAQSQDKLEARLIDMVKKFKI